MKYGSRKFIIAILLALVTLAICGIVIDITPAASLVEVIPSILGFATTVLTAIAVMYPASNVLEAIKGG